MADLLSFHGVSGLWPGVNGLAALGEGGHTIHSPDLFQGNRFENAAAGLDYVQQVGWETIADRGLHAADEHEDVRILLGISMGSTIATYVARRRPGLAGVVLLHACGPKDSEDPDWPASTPVQIHSMDRDPYFRIKPAAALLDEAGEGDLHLYPGGGHLFADPSLRDYDPDQARLMLGRISAFIDRVS